MPNYGHFQRVGPSITGGRAMPWTPAEDALLGHGFIDLDLDGPPLYRWCRANGVLRSPGAIDARLAKLAFFDTEELKQKIAPGPKAHLRRLHRDPERAELARRQLANQIALAKLEAATAPLYRPKDDDWKTA